MKSQRQPYRSPIPKNEQRKCFSGQKPPSIANDPQIRPPGADLNDHLSSSHLLASTLLQNTILGNTASDLVVQHEGPYDFYQHPNIQQVTQCQCVLRRFSEELSKLMGDWPDHPALLQLVVIIDRIQGFSLSSPLSKFLNGLEILLAKSQDWEENASRNLSLRKNLDEVTQLIFQWRKLELNCWSLSLDNAMKRHVEKSYRHWFSIYQLIEDYLQVEQEKENDQEQSFQSVTKTLQAFIEGSTLGEFQARLHMILVFHCHVLLVPQTPRKDSLCSLLWNLYHYYKQFLPSVEARIHELRKPVEKELKDFVKISKWNDVSFWSVKQSVEKTHRTLFKHIKKFEATLNEASASALVESIHEDQLDFMGTAADLKVKRNAVQQLASLLNSPSSEASSIQGSGHQVIASPSENSMVQDRDPGFSNLNCGEDIYSAASLQCRLPKLTKRMRQLCNTFIKESSMPSLFENLNTFTEGIIESVQELQNLTVNQAAEKEKQKSEAKHILMQKQRALAELFKMLSKTGTYEIVRNTFLNYTETTMYSMVLYMRKGYIQNTNRNYNEQTNIDRYRRQRDLPLWAYILPDNGKVTQRGDVWAREVDLSVISVKMVFEAMGVRVLRQEFTGCRLVSFSEDVEVMKYI
ncbi:unnamed protein product [Ranitomeya imitator]|uniref:Uncharacterized protein n=1 Tax=Ranitomeya imitator TaxID=111125 RepID=A0ABN9MHA6_9NEOB|nr:unnamed protein product [Ranitomeya imitator]